MSAESKDISIKNLIVKDIRFPTSIDKHGSDAMHTDPDYSCAYVTLVTNRENLRGYGLTFTIGKGTEIVVKAIEALAHLVVDKNLNEIIEHFDLFWRSLTSHHQLRWIGPEKGVIHLATSAIVNSIWDLWAKLENKPIWKLLVDLTPEQLVSTIDFRYITDALTKEEAIQLLKSNESFRKIREKEIVAIGYPAYTTSVGWIGYDDETLKKLCKEAIGVGFNAFKVKVGQDINDDKRRLALIRGEITFDRQLMCDANQRWDVNEAIDWVQQLSEYKPLWIEEPTSPDDILGHLKISEALRPYSIGVALGEQCHNRVIFKQLLQSQAMQYCQLDATRLGGLNEVLAVILMAAKFKVPICPHAGGVGLCQYVQHFSIFDYICINGSTEGRMIEYVNHLHDVFKDELNVTNARYFPPTKPGFGVEMKAEAIETYVFPTGAYWKDYFKKQFD